MWKHKGDILLFFLKYIFKLFKLFSRSKRHGMVIEQIYLKCYLNWQTWLNCSWWIEAFWLHALSSVFIVSGKCSQSIFLPSSILIKSNTVKNTDDSWSQNCDYTTCDKHHSARLPCVSLEHFKSLQSRIFIQPYHTPDIWYWSHESQHHEHRKIKYHNIHIFRPHCLYLLFVPFIRSSYQSVAHYVYNYWL